VLQIPSGTSGVEVPVHDDPGLTRDLEVLRLRRREVLGWLAAGSVLAGCGVATSGGDDGTGGLADDTCSDIPPETAGPYPGDGSNGPNALALDGIVRSDLRSSFAGVTGTAEGVPLTIRLTLVRVSEACAAGSGLAVYLWHCDRDGLYSLYTRPDQNWLRGVQTADVDGIVAFTTIYPGCYDGRWPHVHFEVFESQAAALSGAEPLATSQLALPSGASGLVYEVAGYESSVSNFSRTSLDSDNVFSDDGGATQLPAMSGDVDTGFVADLEVGV
jgi:protocatechuate 3,4-dioxygenase beta subunit